MVSENERRLEEAPFKVTTAAVEQIAALGGALRLTLEEGGCCGTTYVFTLADPRVATASDEISYRTRYVRLILSTGAARVLPGAVLDYSARVKPPRFRVLNNPNTDEICACRRSFGQPWPGPKQPTCRAYVPMPWDVDYDPPRHWKRQTGYDDQRSA